MQFRWVKVAGPLAIAFAVSAALVAVVYAATSEDYRAPAVVVQQGGVPVVTSGAVVASPATVPEVVPDAVATTTIGPVPVTEPATDPVPVQAPTMVTALMVVPVPATTQDTVADVPPATTGATVPDESTGYRVDAADGSRGEPCGDTGSTDRCVHGPGGTFEPGGAVLSGHMASAYGVPDGTPIDQVNFGQPGGEDAPVQFHTEAATDLRMLSCVSRGVWGTVPADGLTPDSVAQRLADGTCVVVGTQTPDGLPG